MDSLDKATKPSGEYNSLWLGLTLVALIFFAFFVEMESVRGWVEKAGIWAPLLFILLKASTIVIAPLSGSPLYPLVGILFGFWPGILYVAIGDFMGNTTSFFISRIFGRKAMLRFLSNKEESMVARIVDHIGEPRGFLQACLTLFAIPEVLSYGAGLSKLPYIKFILILLPFSMTMASVLVFFGSILAPESESLLIGMAVPVVGAIIVILGSTLFLKSIKKRETIKTE